VTVGCGWAPPSDSADSSDRSDWCQEGGARFGTVDTMDEMDEMDRAPPPTPQSKPKEAGANKPDAAAVEAPPRIRTIPVPALVPGANPSHTLLATGALWSHNERPICPAVTQPETPIPQRLCRKAGGG